MREALAAAAVPCAVRMQRGRLKVLGDSLDVGENRKEGGVWGNKWFTMETKREETSVCNTSAVVVGLPSQMVTGRAQLRCRRLPQWPVELSHGHTVLAQKKEPG